jgi:hypothetical protein
VYHSTLGLRVIEKGKFWKVEREGCVPLVLEAGGEPSGEIQRER